MTNTATYEFKAKCGDCGTIFPVVQLPARLDVAAMLMKTAVCPKCESTRLFVATETNGNGPESTEA